MKIVSVAVILGIVVSVAYYIYASAPAPPIYVYTDWRDEQLNALSSAIRMYLNTSGKDLNVTVIQPSTPQATLRGVVMSEVLRGYLAVRRGEVPAATFVTRCGRDLAAFLYVGVWGPDDYADLTSLTKTFSSLDNPAVLSCSLYGYFKPLSKTFSAVYAVPFAVYRANLIFANITMLRNYGLGIPQTIDDLLSVCATLKSYNVTCITIPGFDPRATNGYEPTVLLLWEDILLAVAGPDKYMKFYYGDIAANDSDILAAARIFAEVASYIHPNWRNTQLDDSLRMLINGTAAILVNGGWILPRLKSLAPNIEICPVTNVTPSCSIVVAPFPGTDEVFNMVVYGFGVVNNPSSSSAVNLVKSFLESPAYWLLINGILAASPYKTMQPTDYVDPVQRWQAEAFAEAKRFVLSLSQGGLWSIPGVDPMAYTINMVNSAIGGVNPDTISRDWASSFQRQLDGQRQMWNQVSMRIGLSDKPFSE